MQPALSGLYIHIPWCVKKCPYCDFNSHEPRNDQGQANKKLPEKKYLQALLDDADSEIAALASPLEISSVFIGGGTPSLMSGEFYASLFEQLRKRFIFNDNAEITIEANPGAVDESHFADYIKAGINRLSLGVQSFSDDSLQRLGRIHDAKSIYRAFETSRKSGFDNINIDLMHGLPEQSIEQGLFDLDSAFALAPEHISWYQLTIEKNTAFYKQPPTLPAENLLDNLFIRGLERLAAAGYSQYEISAFSLANKQSQHNKNYWQFGDYIGIGAGAHGKLTHIDSDGLNKTALRRWKTRLPEDYMNKKTKLAGSSQIAVDELPLEFMMNALRLNAGFSTALFETITGLSIAAVEPKLRQLQKQGLIEQAADIYRPTEKGRLFLNDVIEAFA